MERDSSSNLLLAQAGPAKPGFTLPPPAPPAPTPPGPTPAPQPPRTDIGVPLKLITTGPYDALTPTALTIGGAVLLVLVIAFIFVGRAIRGHLSARKASPGAASNAGWALFGFLVSIAATVVLGVIGNLWLVLAFIVPMGVLSLITLILLIILYSSATRRAG